MELLSATQLRERIGRETGLSDLILISQDMIDRFAELTDDYQFIHTDPQRAAPLPFGGTIAHGFLIVSMLSKMMVASTNGRLTLHFLPGYAPDLNPDALLWSHVKRTRAARWLLLKGEKLRDKIEHQLGKIQRLPRLVRSFFQAPSVAYIGDC